MENIIYLDHAATTPARPEVVNIMVPYLEERYGNPSSGYSIAADSKQAIETARQNIAKVIGASPGEIYFTSGGTEADNWAMRGTARAFEGKGKHIITSSIEHHAILHTAAYLEKQGYEVTYLPVDETGTVSPRSVMAAIRPDTVLISIMFANNEIGTIQPIREIATIAHRRGIVFHTDAVQAFGQVPIDVKSMNIDMLSASAHKLQGPKGVGMLYVREGLEVENLLFGGGQEKKKRAGTENVAGIVGFGEAARLALEEMPVKIRKEIGMRDYLIKRILREIPNTRLNGHRFNRLPGNTNFSFQSVEGGELLVMLDAEGICASTGSACTTGQTKPSHVLTAIGLSEELAHGSLRLTLGSENTRQQIDFVIDKLKGMVGQIRAVSKG